jgi:hypothetical protein
MAKLANLANCKNWEECHRHRRWTRTRLPSAGQEPGPGRGEREPWSGRPCGQRSSPGGVTHPLVALRFQVRWVGIGVEESEGFEEFELLRNRQEQILQHDRG